MSVDEKRYLVCSFPFLPNAGDIRRAITEIDSEASWTYHTPVQKISPGHYETRIDFVVPKRDPHFRGKFVVREHPEGRGCDVLHLINSVRALREVASEMSELAANHLAEQLNELCRKAVDRERV